MIEIAEAGRNEIQFERVLNLSVVDRFDRYSKPLESPPMCGWKEIDRPGGGESCKKTILGGGGGGVRIRKVTLSENET